MDDPQGRKGSNVGRRPVTEWYRFCRKVKAHMFYLFRNCMIQVPFFPSPGRTCESEESVIQASKPFYRKLLLREAICIIDCAGNLRILRLASQWDDRTISECWDIMHHTSSVG